MWKWLKCISVYLKCDDCVLWEMLVPGNPPQLINCCTKCGVCVCVCTCVCVYLCVCVLKEI